ncbi:MAG: F0F1 ATP synthase subunit alpha [Kiritimatiellia bacterium]
MSSTALKIPLFKLTVEEKGSIQDIKDAVVRISGLPSCLTGEIVDMGDGVLGLVMEFDQESVCALALGATSKLRMGKEVRAKNEPFMVHAGEACLGRMLTALGEPCDEGEPLTGTEKIPVFRDAPSLMDRDPIDTMLLTGTKVVDTLMPIGRGQRQLILGDRMTGKSSIALDAILNQKDSGVLCIYCCIGKSVSGLEKVMSILVEGKALPFTTVIAATDNSPAAEQYIAPFTAAAIGDWFVQRGRDVLVVLDDMTKHAWAYRQLSLLLDRPPGREAYPGDIFYLHTQLMEQAGSFNERHGYGTMTFLALADTQQGDLTGYIPSNLISMCDGQIILSGTIFAEGVRPAVDPQMSLSIVGGRSQRHILRQLAADVRTAHAAYLEMAQLSRLSSLSDDAKAVLLHGEAIRDVFQQGHHERCSEGELVLLLYALRHGFLDAMTPDSRKTFVSLIGDFARDMHPGVMRHMEESDDLTSEIEDGVRQIVKDWLAQEQHDVEAIVEE